MTCGKCYVTYFKHKLINTVFTLIHDKIIYYKIHFYAQKLLPNPYNNGMYKTQFPFFFV